MIRINLSVMEVIEGDRKTFQTDRCAYVSHPFRGSTEAQAWETSRSAPECLHRIAVGEAN